ncbi:MAG: tetratricopeptide repeat protein [Deltaproteobacteria bacterium]|nr:tetratricopeptide repeat protein [Deltaproteobacteria bacterium]
MARPDNPAAGPPSGDNASADFVQRGKVAIVRRQYQEAVKICRLGLLAHPTYVEGRLVLAMALMALGRHEEVLAEMRVALELEPDHPMAHLLKGEALLHAGDPRRAKEALEVAHELDPHNEKVLKLLDEADASLEDQSGPLVGGHTDTKVYPAPRAQQVRTGIRGGVPARAASEPVDEDDDEDHDHDDDDEGTDVEEEPRRTGDERPAGDRDRYTVAEPLGGGRGRGTGARVIDTGLTRAGREVEDYDGDLGTAPWVPPARGGTLTGSQSAVDWGEETLREGLRGRIREDVRGDTEHAALADRGAAARSSASGDELPLSTGESLAALPDSDEHAPLGPRPTRQVEPTPSVMARLRDGRAGTSINVTRETDLEEMARKDSRGHSTVEAGPEEAMAQVARALGQRKTAALLARVATPMFGSLERSDELLSPPEVWDGHEVNPAEEEVEDAEEDADDDLDEDADDALLRAGATREGHRRNTPPPVDEEPEDLATVGAPPPVEFHEDLPDEGTYEPTVVPRNLEALRAAGLLSPATARPGFKAEFPSAPSVIIGGNEARGPDAPASPTRRALESGGGGGIGSPRRPGEQTAALDLKAAEALGRGKGFHELPSSEEREAPELDSVDEDAPDADRHFGGRDSHAPPDADEGDGWDEELPDSDAVGRVAFGGAGHDDDPLPVSAELSADFSALPAAPGYPGHMPPVPPPTGAVGAPPELVARSDETLPPGTDEHAFTRVAFDALPDSVDAPPDRFDEPYAPPPTFLGPAEGGKLPVGYPGSAPRVERQPVSSAPSQGDISVELDPYTSEVYRPAPTYLGPADGGKPPAASDRGNSASSFAEAAPPAARVDRSAPERRYEAHGELSDSFAGPGEAAPPYDRQDSYGLDSVSRDGELDYDSRREVRRHPSVSVPEHPDEEELALEPADQSGRRPYPQRTASLEPGEGRSAAYVDSHPAAAKPRSASAGRGRGREGGPASRTPAEDSLIDELGGGSQPFQVPASAPRAKAKAKAKAPSRRAEARRPAMPRPPPYPKGATSFLTMLLGPPGSNRWLFWLLGSVGVLAAAVGIGFFVRYMRVSRDIDHKRREAVVRLKNANAGDYLAAAQIFGEILSRRPDDGVVAGVTAHLNAAVPVEFGDPPPLLRAPSVEGEPQDEQRVAARIYLRLQQGQLKEAAELALQGRTRFSSSALLVYLDGRVALLQGRTAAAIESLQQALRLDPRHVLALAALGDALAVQEELENALKRYDEALAVNPEHVASHLGRSRVLAARGLDLSTAENRLVSIVEGERRVLASRGQRGWAYLQLARLMVGKGRPDQVERFLKEAKANEPAQDAVFQDALAALLIDLSRLSEAEQAARRADTMMVGRPHPHYRLAQVYLAQGRAREALEALQRAQALPFSTLLRAQVFVLLGELPAARREAEQALKVAPGIEGTLVLAKVLGAEGRADEAERVLRPLLASNPDSAGLLVALGETYLLRGQAKAAIDKFEQALRKDRGAMEARLKLADAYAADGNYEAAHRELIAAARTSTWNVAARKRLAELELEKWNLVQARSDLEQVLRLAPKDEQARLALIQVLTAQRDYGGAEAELRRLEGARPGVAALARGRLALRRYDARAAVPLLAEATRAIPRDAEAWSLLVRAQLDADNNVSGAQSALRELEARHPDSPEALSAEGLLEMSRGKLPAAVRVLVRAVKLLERHRRPPRVQAELLVLLGRAQQDGGSQVEALAQYDAAMRVCPRCPDPHHRRGLLLDEKGQGQEAISSIRRAVELDAKNREYYLDLAKVYEANSMPRPAVEMYRKYLSFNPPEELARDAQQAMDSLQK